MRRSGLELMLVCLALGICAQAGAESFRSRLEKGNSQLVQGNTAGALDQYRELLTEDPESPLIHYNLGLSHYGEGVNLAQGELTEDAITSLDKAKEEFDLVGKNAPDPGLRMDAAYNHANATAQQAKACAAALKAGKGVVAEGEIKGPPDLYKLTVESFEGAVKEYEDLLKVQPDHAGAKQNLDHIRYLLKSMLQNPPPPQDQQQQQQQDGDKQDQDQEKQDQEKEGDQNQDQQGQEQQQDEGQQQAQQEQAQQQEQPQDQQEQAQMEQKQMPEGNTEALLQSLEDIDEREQREVKDKSRGNPVQGNWW